MLANVKSAVHKTKRFIDKHPTLTACATTAVVTAYMVHDKDVGQLKAIAARQMLHQDEHLAMLMDATSFIDAKGMTREFLEFAPRMRD